jgi:spore maturation protein CgeB
MKIIYAGIKKDNYNPERRGFSFEYNNFYLTLKGMSGVEVIEYPLEAIVGVGKKKFNQDLLNLVGREKPDLFFAFMLSEEFDTKTLDAVRGMTKSIAWFADDTWRLENYSRRYAPHFTWAITTWSKAKEKYARHGINNIIRSQWGCNPDIWKPVPVARDIDVSFVGQRTSTRQKIVEELKKAGIKIRVRGRGWPGGGLAEEEMIKTFSRSKINLNFNIPPQRWRLKLIARLFLKRSAQRIVPDFWNLGSNFRSWINMAILQIKARPFELSACGAFVISGYADDLENYYKENEEMVFYRSTEELIQKINYYLSHAEEREAIAGAGHERTIKDHTYEKRFREIFSKVLNPKP